jgi:EmrB/QacA subfamily drug resistance transporter
MSAPSPRSTSQAGRIQGAALYSVIAALMLTLLLEALDQTIVSTALPKIIASLNGFDRYTWVITAYLLASTAVLPVIGKVSDIFGRKWFLLGGVVLFLIGSALSGAAQTMTQLIIFRALQGLGAGMGISLVFTVVGDLFPPRERGKWMGVFSAVYGFSSVFGPTIGGWLADHGPLVGSFVTDQTRWRWVFYINVPVGLLALSALALYLPLTTSASGTAAWRRIDFLGAALATAATICLLLGLSWGSDGTYAWNSSQVELVLAAAAILAGTFLFRETRAAEPILPLSLFRDQTVAADAVAALGIGLVLLPLVLYIPLFLQGILKVSATDAGLSLLPLTISLVIGGGMAGTMVGRIGRYRNVVITAAVLLLVGLALLTRLTATIPLAVAEGFMVVTGLGIGVFFPINTLVMQNAVPRQMMGVSTGLVRYLQALGQTLGAAIIGTVVNNSLSSGISSHLSAADKAQLTPQGVKAATDPQILTSSAYHDRVQQMLQHYAIQGATAHIPAGPQHAQAVATATHQAILQADALLNRTIDVVRASLDTAIVQGFTAMLAFGVLILIAAYLLKDIPLQGAESWGAGAESSGAGAESWGAGTGAPGNGSPVAPSGAWQKANSTK